MTGNTECTEIPFVELTPSTPEDLVANRAGQLSARQSHLLQTLVAPFAHGPGALLRAVRQTLVAPSAQWGADPWRERFAAIARDLPAARVIAVDGVVEWRPTTRVAGHVLGEYQARIPGETVPRAVLGTLVPGNYRCYCLSGVVVGAEALGAGAPEPGAEHIAHYQTLLRAVLGVTDAEVSANRAGLLAPSQRATVRRGSKADAFGVLVALGVFLALVCGGLAAAGYTGAIPVSSPGGLALGAVGALLVIVAPGVWGLRRTAQKIANARVRCVRGPIAKITRRVSSRDQDDNWRESITTWLEVGAERFQLDHLTYTGVASVLVSGVIHQVYIADTLGVLVAIEPAVPG